MVCGPCQAFSVTGAGAAGAGLRMNTFRADRRWSKPRRYSLFSGALTFALLLAFGAELFDGWNGLVQRVLILIPLVWIALLGAHLVEVAGAERAVHAR